MFAHRILSVERVHNAQLALNFANAVEAVAKRRAGAVNIQVFGFHGSRSMSADELVGPGRFGVDPRYGVGGYYGRGAYFASQSVYSHAGYAHNVGPNINEILVCQVLLGNTQTMTT